MVKAIPLLFCCLSLQSLLSDSQLNKRYDSHCMQMSHFEEIHSKWIFLLDLSYWTCMLSLKYLCINSKWVLWPSSLYWHALVLACTFVLYLLALTSKNTMPLTPPPPKKKKITCRWFAFTNLSVVSLHDAFLLNSCKFQASYINMYILLTFLWICMVLSFVNSQKCMPLTLLQVCMVLWCLQLCQERLPKRRLEV